MDVEIDEKPLSPYEASQYWLQRVTELAKGREVEPQVLGTLARLTKLRNIGTEQGQIRPHLPMGRHDLAYYLKDWHPHLSSETIASIVQLREDEMVI